MGKLFWQISTTLDGFMEGPNGELDRTAQVIDADFEAYASEMLASIDAFVIGRKTYDLFVGYWPTATGNDADLLNSLPKYVVSGTLAAVDWNNGNLIRPSDLESAVRNVKDSFERNVAIFGSAELAALLSRLGLIDEYRLLVTPYFLGEGNPAFKKAGAAELQWVSSERWASGTMALTYTAKSAESKGEFHNGNRNESIS